MGNGRTIPVLGNGRSRLPVGVLRRLAGPPENIPVPDAVP